MLEPQNPILLMPFEGREFRRKSGGGGDREPLVPLTTKVIGGLQNELDVAIKEAERRGSSQSNPLPLKIDLRSKALAKSNRPYGFIAQSAMPITAGDKSGQLIVEATPPSLTNLRAAIGSATSNADKFWVSTFESFSVWDLVRDVLHCDDEDQASEFLDRAIVNGQTLRFDFFPWALREGFSPRRLGYSAQSVGELEPRKTDELVAALGSVGLNVTEVSGSFTRPLVFGLATSRLDIPTLQTVEGLRSVRLVPEYARTDSPVASMSYVFGGRLEETAVRSVPSDAPLVGLLDSGVDSTVLSPYISGAVDYDVPRRQDRNHGTFVAGLIADSRSLNAGSALFPSDQARVFDAQIMPAGNINERELFERIDETVRSQEAAGIRVWNCSFGTIYPGAMEYGSLAQNLDQLSDELGILFVISAGNCSVGPLRTWPPAAGVDYQDSLSAPGEAIRALTVGARSHLGGFVPAPHPSSYSRRGPTFARHVKPDLSHWAGDLDEGGAIGGFGTKSIGAGDRDAESVGTSFSAPIISSVAANVWEAVGDLEGRGAPPELVRGLLVHAASVGNYKSELAVRDYAGWGIPGDSSLVLSDTPNRITTVHDVDMVPGNDWIRRPFPMPPSLLDGDGRFSGRVTLTIAYAPPLDAAFGEEIVRHDVSGSFGRYITDARGAESFKGIVSADGRRRGYWEEDRVADGKWSPLKSASRAHPRGIVGGEWALRLELTERMPTSAGLGQRVFAIVTLESLVDTDVVYRQGVLEARRLAYRAASIVTRTRVQIS